MLRKVGLFKNSLYVTQGLNVESRLWYNNKRSLVYRDIYVVFEVENGRWDVRQKRK